MTIPSTHKALVVVERGKVEIKEQAIPQYSDEEVLIRVKAVSINPTDWKSIDFFFEPGSSAGCDFAGEIVALGSNAKGWKIGDAVAGFVQGGRPDRYDGHNGSFQEYVVSLPEMIWRKPASISDVEAASITVAVDTAVYALQGCLDVPFGPIANPEPILIWAGSTAVGMYAIQLAALSGLKVVTVASQHNHDLVKSLGAAAVFDYKDANVVNQIKDWTRAEGFNGIKKGIDTISEKGSTEIAVSILDSDGSLIVLLPPPKDLDSKGVKVTLSMLYDILKRENEKDHKLFEDFYQLLPSYIESGKLPSGAVPIKTFSGGLNAVPEALDYMRQGKVSGQKLVVAFD